MADEPHDHALFLSFAENSVAIHLHDARAAIVNRQPRPSSKTKASAHAGDKIMDLNLWYVLRCVFVFLVLVTSLLLATKLCRAIKHGCAIFRDYFVLWNVAFGAHPTRRNMSQPMRLHPYVCNPRLLDGISIEELFTFGKSMVNSDISCETFRKVVVSYRYAIIFRERLDGSLRGMCLLGKNRTEHNGKKCTILTMGLALFHNYYQGGPYLYYVVLYHILKELIARPRTPIYILTKLFSYKSYLALISSCKTVYPIYNKEIPEFERSLLNSFAESVLFPEETYNPDTFILEREMSHVKQHVATVTPQDLDNPHIKFFTDRNPGWEKGHCMFCISEVDWFSILKIASKAIKRAIRGRSGVDTKDKLASRKNANRFRQHFDRHLSYQQHDAKSEVLKEYTIKDGHAVLKHRVSDDIYVPEEQGDDDSLEM